MSFPSADASLKAARKYPVQVIVFLSIIVLTFMTIGSLLRKRGKKDTKKKRYKLKEHGFCIFNNVLNTQEIDHLKKRYEENKYHSIQDYLLNHHRIRELVRNSTSKDYQFQDYIWIMQNSSVHTCHRDNNGSFFNKNQKYPSYTMIVYLEDMEKCLGVIPESQLSPNSYFINFTNSVVDLICKKGDVILFNANLIHVGTTNANQKNLRVQLKVTHKQDIPYISYYENFHKVLDKESKVPDFVRKMQKDLSCTFPGFSDMTRGENIRIYQDSAVPPNILLRDASENVEGSSTVIPDPPFNLLQKMFSFLFYGDSDYYDIPNVY